jgi:hypothetical protein
MIPIRMCRDTLFRDSSLRHPVVTKMLTMRKYYGKSPAYNEKYYCEVNAMKIISVHAVLIYRYAW